MIRRYEPSPGAEQQPEPDNITPLVSLTEDGILIVDFSEYDRITLASLQYVRAEHATLSPGKKIPVLFKGKNVGSVDYHAQRYLSTSEVCEGTAAGAIVVTSFLERHLARMFLIYHRPPYPVQVFSAEGDALAWLRGFLPPA